MRAMALQLDACRQRARAEAMFIGDQDGLCLAWSGDDSACEEVVATVAPLTRRMENYEGRIAAEGRSFNVRVRRFEVGGSMLFVGAVGGGGELRATQLHHSIGGVARILQT